MYLTTTTTLHDHFMFAEKKLANTYYNAVSCALTGCKARDITIHRHSNDRIKSERYV